MKLISKIVLLQVVGMMFSLLAIGVWNTINPLLFSNTIFQISIAEMLSIISIICLAIWLFYLKRWFNRPSENLFDRMYCPHCPLNFRFIEEERSEAEWAIDEHVKNECNYFKKQGDE